MPDIPPSIPPDKDDAYLRRLVIAHIMYATLHALILLLTFSLAVIYGKLGMLWQKPSDNPMVHSVSRSLIFISILPTLILVPNVISAATLRYRKYRGFSLTIAALNCICAPLGTVLGVFTIVILMRDSVAAKYREKR